MRDTKWFNILKILSYNERLKKPNPFSSSQTNPSGDWTQTIRSQHKEDICDSTELWNLAGAWEENKNDILWRKAGIRNTDFNKSWLLEHSAKDVGDWPPLSTIQIGKKNPKQTSLSAMHVQWSSLACVISVRIDDHNGLLWHWKNKWAYMRAIDLVIMEQ